MFKARERPASCVVASSGDPEILHHRVSQHEKEARHARSKYTTDFGLGVILSGEIREEEWVTSWVVHMKWMRDTW